MKDKKLGIEVSDIANKCLDDLSHIDIEWEAGEILIKDAKGKATFHFHQGTNTEQ